MKIIGFGNFRSPSAPPAWAAIRAPARPIKIAASNVPEFKAGKASKTPSIARLASQLIGFSRRSLAFLGAGLRLYCICGSQWQPACLYPLAKRGG